MISLEPLLTTGFAEAFSEICSKRLQRKSVVQGFSAFTVTPGRVALLLRDIIQLRLSQWGYWVPLFRIWDPVAGPGRTPMPGNNSGLRQTLAIEPRYRPPGQRGILSRGLQRGVRVGRPFGARR